MTKLSTQAVRNLLIQHYTKDAELVEPIAREFDRELVRIYKTQFGYSDCQVDTALSQHRKQPVNIINQYFHLRSDKWLREQLKSL